MSQLRTNAILDASGGNTATINGMTPTAQSLQGFRNRIINGAMVIDQRNAGASVSYSNSGAYTLDRWVVDNTTDGTISVQQSSVAPAGFTNSCLITVTTADASLSSTQRCRIRQPIEGFNVADFGFGTASAITVTLSFWVRSSLTGTFGGALNNATVDRSYPFSYTISAANTWEQKSVTIAGDTSGTWVTNSGIGLLAQFGLGIGSNFSGTANAWTGSQIMSTTGATSLIGTSGATFYITGVQLEAGSVATPFERRDYGTELARCQRYFWALNSASSNGNFFRYATGLAGSTSGTGFTLIPQVTLRATPAVSFSGAVALFDGVTVHASNNVAIGADGSSNAAVNINATTATAVLTQFRPYQLLSNNNKTSYIFFDSEL
jgi:hypothetical protein